MSILDLFQFLKTDILPIVLVLFGVGFVFGFCYFFYSIWRNKRKEKKIEKAIAKTGEKYEDTASGFFYDVLKQSTLVGNADALPVQSVLIPDGAVLKNGIKGTIEIDMAFATTKGIFVAECKHRHGYLTGSLAGKTWTDDRSLFSNPLLQNDNHIRFLRKSLIDNNDLKAYADIPIYNLFIGNVPIILYKMGAKETIDSIFFDNQNHIFVILDKNTSQMRQIFAEHLSALEDKISTEDADKINSFLISCRGDEKTLQEHIEYIKSLHPEE